MPTSLDDLPLSGINCRDAFDHIQTCDICSRLYTVAEKKNGGNLSRRFGGGVFILVVVIFFFLFLSQNNNVIHNA